MPRHRIVSAGDPGHVLVASGFGESGGGLFVFDGDTVERIDRVSATGLAVDGDHLYRLLWSPGDGACTSELLVYDALGVGRYVRLDGLGNPHDLLARKDDLVVTATSSNRVLWLGPSGELRRAWCAPGEGEAWHVNCLLDVGGRLLASAFGRYQHEREWQDGGEEGRGIVFDVESGEDVLAGLSWPHHPRWFDGAFSVCNSGCRELLQLEPDGRTPRRRLALAGYTRGFAVADDVLYVGESVHRLEPEGRGRDGTASIALVSRHDFRLLERVSLPCREVYDLVLLPERLLGGLRTGFRTNGHRVTEQGQFALFDAIGVAPERLWATCDPLPSRAMRAAITASVPRRMRPGAIVPLACRVENRGAAFLASAAPYPVHLSYRWIEPETGRPLAGVEGRRTVFAKALPPGGSAELMVAIDVPAVEGDLVLRLTLVQEEVAWFDDIDPESACEHPVRVHREA